MTMMDPLQRDGAPRQITDFEVALAGPGGAQLARSVLLRIDEMERRIDRQLRMRSPVAAYERLQAAKGMLQAVRATMLTARQLNQCE